VFIKRKKKQVSLPLLIHVCNFSSGLRSDDWPGNNRRNVNRARASHLRPANEAAPSYQHLHENEQTTQRKKSKSKRCTENQHRAWDSTKEMISLGVYLDRFLRPSQLDALGLCFAAILQEAQRGPRHSGRVRVQLQPVQLPDNCKRWREALTQEKRPKEGRRSRHEFLGFEVQSSLWKRKAAPVPFLKFCV
jgi:hypothetical protein